MHRSMFSLQQYVRRTGDLIFPPPFVVEDMDMLVFVLKAKNSALLELIDRELNAPWQQAFALRGLLHNYQPVGDWIVVVVSEVKNLYPKQFASRRQAVVKPGDPAAADDFEDITAEQRELLVMVPLDDYGADPLGNAALQRSTQLWYVPFALNDLPPAVLAGREIFGYPKLLASFRTDPDAAERHEHPLIGSAVAGWEDLSIKTYGPVERKPPDPTKSKYYLGPVEVVRLEAKRGVEAHPPPTGADKIVEDAATRFGKSLELLFLRQYLDPQYDGLASYQAVVSGSITASDGTGGDLPDLKPVTEGPRYRFSFPSHGPEALSIGHVFGLEHDADGLVTPCATFALDDRKLVVTRGEIRWDKP